MPAPITGPLWTKNFIILSFSNALLFSGFHLIMPVLPLFIADCGGTDRQIGLIMGSFTFSAILIRLFTEPGIDRLGKKNFLLLGMLVCMLATAAYYRADSVGAALAVRLFHGVGFGIATTLYATLAVDIIPAARRGEGIGYFGLGTTLSMAIAPALGVWLVAGHGFGVLFAVASAGQLVAILGLGAFTGVPAPAPSSGRGAASLLDRVLERKAVFPACLALLTGAALSGVLGFVALMAKQAHLTTVGYFFTVTTSFVFLSRLFVGRIFDSRGHAWVILPGAVCLLIGQIILSQTATTPVLLTAAVFQGLGVGILFPSLQAWMVGLVPPDRRGIVNATFYNFLDTGVGCGAVVLGIVAEAAGYPAVYLTAAAVMGLFIVVYAASLVRGRPPAAGQGRAD
ncbi:MFS transporter [Anaeroselena agilis]|uniref:MFS transporter n=1 Tax=Anaeroselena agilis TaxID=3063788 RepID=A0ABU3P1L4_9FIRM|nr:MFS transporter [Selenomonadales bacterium 4137-cl]